MATKIIQTELPQDVKFLITKALENLEKQIKFIEKLDGEGNEMNFLKFDLFNIKNLMKYKVVVELTDIEYENFTKENGVDYPVYLKIKGV